MNHQSNASFRDLQGPSTNLNDSFLYLFLHSNSWNSFSFIYLQPEIGTRFGRSLPVSSTSKLHATIFGMNAQCNLEMLHAIIRAMLCAIVCPVLPLCLMVWINVKKKNSILYFQLLKYYGIWYLNATKNPGDLVIDIPPNFQNYI